MHLGEDDSGSDFEEEYKEDYIKAKGTLPGSKREKKMKKMGIGDIIANEASSTENESSGSASDNYEEPMEDTIQHSTQIHRKQAKDIHSKLLNMPSSKRLSMMKDYEKFVKNKSAHKRHTSVKSIQKPKINEASKHIRSGELNLSESSSEDETYHSSKTKRIKTPSKDSVFISHNTQPSNFDDVGAENSNLRTGLQDAEMALQLESLAKSYNSVAQHTQSSQKDNHTNTEARYREYKNQISDINKLLSLGEGVSVEDTSDISETKSGPSKVSEVDGGSIEITLQDHANQFDRLKRKKIDPQTQFLNEMNRIQREFRIILHKCSFLCHLSHLRYINCYLGAPGIVNENRKQLLLAIALSIVPTAHLTVPEKLNMVRLSSFVSWFRDAFPVTNGSGETGKLFEASPDDILQRSLSNFVCERQEHLVFIFILAARAMGWNTRLTMNLDTISIKKSEKSNLEDFQTKNNPKTCDLKNNLSMKSKTSNIKDRHYDIVKKQPKLRNNKINKSNTIPQFDGLDDFNESSCSNSNKNYSDKNKSISPKNSKNTEPSKNEPDENYKNRCRSVAATIKQIRQRRKMEKTVKENDSNRNINDIHKKPKNNGKKDNDGQLSNKALSEADSRRASTSIAPNLYTRKLCSDSDSNESSDGATDKSYSSENKSSPTKRSKKTTSKSSAKAHRKVDSEATQSSKGCQYWAEVYIDPKWVPVDMISGRINCASVIEHNLFGKYSKAKNKSITHKSGQILYVVAANSDGSLKDVTKRYTSDKYMTVTRKARAPVEEWIGRTLRPFKASEKSSQGKIETVENRHLEKVLEDAPMPKSLGAFKNHPYYVLKKDLNKNQAIYPYDAPTLGFIQGHGIYARECVHELQSRTSWIKHGLVVKIGEVPYKIGTAKSKYDKMSGEKVSNEPLEMFGKWQTEKYIPPAAEDGKVPRNEYGNVELFKPWMLPKGTIHIPIQGLNRIAKKLNIDCAPAMVGWEFSNGAMRPLYDGYVICEEANDYIMDAWNQEMDEQMKKDALKREKRAISNWTKLVRGMLLYKKIAKKYSKK